MEQQQIESLLAGYGYKLTAHHPMGLFFTPNLIGQHAFDQKKHRPIIIDSQFSPSQPHPYVTYTSHQNALMHQHSGIYRFIGENKEDLIEQIEFFTFSSSASNDLKIKTYGADRSESHLDPTPPEFNFAATFEDVFGSKMLYALHQEEIYIDRQGHRRYIDFVLHRKTSNIAIELNGEKYHHPLIISRKQYSSQLFKQNSLIRDGVLVYRWSDRGMQDEYKFKEQLKSYFGNASNFESTPYFKSRRHVDFELYPHQKEAIESIQAKRSIGENTFLVVLPTGTGKTEVFIEDLRAQIASGNSRSALALVPTKDLREQLINRVRQQLPQLTTSNSLNEKADLTVITNAAIVRHYQSISTDHFDYILVDEAHKAAAIGMAKVLEHFTPNSLLGLTATDERLDERKLEQIFGHYKVNLSLEQAIKEGLVPQIRVFRLESNVDFSKVRFNGKDFVRSDLQKTVQIPSRDTLIASLLAKYFSPQQGNTLHKQGIIFCVDVRHTQRMAKALQDAGLKAKSVHGLDRSAIDEYFAGKLQFLCACELLTEGWDAPNTSVVVMARPTMSKAKYMQQLGRGTRLTPGKEALYVIDIVDNYIGAALQPWNIHNLFNCQRYIPFGNLLPTNKPTPQQELIILDGLVEKERRLEPINIFNFEAEFGDMLNEEQLARELFVSTSSVKNWLKKGDISPSKTLPFGLRELHYFSSETVDEIKKKKNIKPHTDDSRKQDFLDFLEKRDYTFSYKIIFLLAFKNCVNLDGEANTDELAHQYQYFYQRLFSEFGQCEKKGNPLNNQKNLTDLAYIKRSISSNPFEKFERKRFFHESTELTVTAMDSVLWQQLTTDDWARIIQQLEQDGQKYFAKQSIYLNDNIVSSLSKKSINNDKLTLRDKQAGCTLDTENESLLLTLNE